MRSIWAVAKNTVAQALRMKVAVLLILLLLIMLPLMGGITEGDGTLKGKLQTFVSYGLSLTSMLLCILTIAISVYTLSSDIKRKHIFLVVTKPICRFQIILGKFLGIVIIDVFLLLVFAAIIYGLTVALPIFDKSTDEEIAIAERQFFTARKELEVKFDDQEIIELAKSRYAELEKVNQLPESMSKDQVFKELINREKIKQRAVEVGTFKSWPFNGVTVNSPEATLFVQFEYEVASQPVDGKIVGEWQVGDDRQEQGQWKTEVYGVSRRDATRIQYEFEVPADCVAEDGYVAVAFMNPYVNGTTVIPKDIKLLYKVGSFNANYIRAVAVILTRLIFLAALGVSFATWLSFPVAIFVCIVVFFIGTFNGFILDSIGYLGGMTTLVYSMTMKPLIWLLPKFDGSYNPTPFIISAKLLSTTLLSEVYLFTVCVKSVLLILFGMLIFKFREIARVTD